MTQNSTTLHCVRRTINNTVLFIPVANSPPNVYVISNYLPYRVSSAMH